MRTSPVTKAPGTIAGGAAVVLAHPTPTNSNEHTPPTKAKSLGRMINPPRGSTKIPPREEIKTEAAGAAGVKTRRATVPRTKPSLQQTPQLRMSHRASSAPPSKRRKTRTVGQGQRNHSAPHPGNGLGLRQHQAQRRIPPITQAETPGVARNPARRGAGNHHIPNAAPTDHQHTKLAVARHAPRHMMTPSIRSYRSLWKHRLVVW